MSEQQRQFPKGLVIHIVVNDANAAIEYYKKALGAVEISRHEAHDGKRLMHAEVKIGESTLYLNDDFPEHCGGKSNTPKALGGTPLAIHQYVKDVDAAIKRCADAGGTVTMPPMDMFWGDRYGQVTDPFGHVWSFGAPIKK